MEVPPTPKQRRKKQPADAKPKQQPPYAVVLFNDEEHTFQYVIETLMKVFGYPKERPIRSRCRSTTTARASCGRAAGSGRTQTGQDSFGGSGLLRGEESGLPSEGDRRAAAGVSEATPVGPR